MSEPLLLNGDSSMRLKAEARRAVENITEELDPVAVPGVNASSGSASKSAVESSNCDVVNKNDM